MAKQRWLMKSEPDAFGIDDLARVRVEPWTGVRNYQARNFMRQMLVGDDVLFYHSNAKPSGVAGLAKVHRTGVVDETQFDPKSPYFDPKSDRAAPRWDCVDVAFVEKLPAVVSLDELRQAPGLEDMLVLRRGMRLSVQPVTADEWKIVVALGRRAGRGPAAGATSGRPSRATDRPRRPAARSSRRPGSSRR